MREPALLRLEDEAAERLLERDGELLRTAGADRDVEERLLRAGAEGAERTAGAADREDGAALLRAAGAGRDVDGLLLRAGAEGAERTAGAVDREEDGATLRLLLAGDAVREPADEEPVVVEDLKPRGTATDDEDDGVD